MRRDARIYYHFAYPQSLHTNSTYNMKNPEDMRWMQRLANYRKALTQLENAVTLANTRPLSNLEKQGLVQAFEYTYELAWNTIKDF